MIEPRILFRNEQTPRDGKRQVTVLIVGQVPPPVNGQSLMIEAFLKGEYEELRLIHVPLRFSRSTKEIGVFDVRKLFLLASTLIHIIVARVRSGATILYYPPAGANMVPVLRDLVLLILTRWLFEKTAFHFHAAGLSKIVSRLPGFLRPLFRAAYNYPDLAIFTTAATSSDAEHLHAKKTAIIPCGISDYYSTRHLFTKDVAPSILFAGILCEEKGVLVLLEACRLLRIAGIHFHLTCAGAFQSAAFEEKVQTFLRFAGIDDVVQFPGVVTGDTKTKLFAKADVFCFPSYYPAESFGVVLIEAMSFALPVVATDWQGIPEVLGRQSDDSTPEGAILVPPEDPVAVANALATLLGSDTMCRQMGMYNRARYLRYFTLDLYRQRLEQELVQLAGNEAGSYQPLMGAPR